jgi:hypothetical protein
LRSILHFYGFKSFGIDFEIHLFNYFPFGFLMALHKKVKPICGSQIIVKEQKKVLKTVRFAICC